MSLFSQCGASGRLLRCIYYACHATAINDQKVNGDYMGHACAFLEQSNPESVALQLRGADCNPLPHLDRANELGQMYGEILGMAVSEVLAAMNEKGVGCVRCQARRSCPYTCCCRFRCVSTGASGVYARQVVSTPLLSSYGETRLPSTRSQPCQLESRWESKEGSAQRRQMQYQLDLLTTPLRLSPCPSLIH